MERPKIIVELSDDQKNLLLGYGDIIDIGEKFLNLPQWFKHVDGNKFEMLVEKQLPEEVKKYIEQWKDRK